MSTEERAELEQLRAERATMAETMRATGVDTFQIVYQASDRLILGVGPFDAGTDFGADFPIVELSIDQLPAVLNNATSYLCADGQTVQAQPC